MEIKSLKTAAEHEAWDRYLLSRTTSVLDLSGWARALVEVCRFRTHLLAASEQEKVTGTLALYNEVDVSDWRESRYPTTPVVRVH